MLRGQHGKNLIIARTTEEAYRFARDTIPTKKGEFIELKMTSGKGEKLKTYRATIHKKEKKE